MALSGSLLDSLAALSLLARLRAATSTQLEIPESFIRKGLVAKRQLTIHPLLPLAAPLHAWPDDGEPNHEHLSWRARQRWSRPWVSTTIYIATAKAAQLFGLGLPRRQPLQLEHDIHVAELVLRLHRQGESVITEDELRTILPGHSKRPDVAVVDGTQNLRVVEFAGAYRAPRIAAFHRWCSAQGLPYELY